MKKLDGFTTWLIESLLQSEVTLRFSNKYRDTDVDKVPAGFWQWLVGKMEETPDWTPAIENENGSRMSRNQVLYLAKSRAKGGAQPVSKATTSASQDTTPTSQPTKSLSKNPWVLAKVANVEGLKVGEPVVLTRSSDGNWVLMTRQGATRNIPSSIVKTAVTSVKDENNAPMMAEDPEELWAKVPPSPTEPKEEPMQGGANPHILDQGKLSEEQRAIDQDFERMMLSPNQNHMMINALAGTGKTSILKHLAWKYGKQGQHWLYLVFNAKNRAEAKETSGGYRKFPDFVEIYTTNSFLGHVMGRKENYGVLPQTDRISSLKGEDDGSKKLEKARIIVDGANFGKLMTDDYHLPEWNEKTEEETVEILKDFGVRDDRGRGRRGRESGFFEVALNTIERTINSIRYNFKERVLTLLGLLKSFSVDPRNKDTLQKEVHRVFDKYDVANHPDGKTENGFFDTHLEDIKERISGYKPNFRDLVLNVLHDLLHYDFMTKNYKEEVIGAAMWLLGQSLPKGTDEVYSVKRKGSKRETRHNLGDYRDFNDDLWIPTINADKVNFPHYDVVLADEVQDFNENQKIMLKKLAEAGAKIVAVGDPNQCVIEGTQITVDGRQVLVEELEVGGTIDVACGNSKIKTSSITDVFKKYVENKKLVKITTEKGNVLVTTRDHTHFAGFTNLSDYCYFTYLMYREDLGYRIGITQWKKKRISRLAGERADKMWLLGRYEKESDARLYEQFYSLHYGIPTWVFNANARFETLAYSNEDVAKLFSLIDTEKAAKRLLDDKGMFLDYPHVTPKCMSRKRYRNFNVTMCGDPRFSSLHRYSVAGSDFDDQSTLKDSGLKIRKAKRGWRVESSCAELKEVYNIIEKISLPVNVVEKARLTNKTLPFTPASHIMVGMSIFVQNGDEIVVDTVSNVEQINYTGYVYDLNVDRYHNFIANGIVTHNSIYRFRGADNDAFHNLSEMLKDASHDKTNWKEKTLSYNYRSRPEVLDFANSHTHVKNLKAGRTNFREDELKPEITNGKMKYGEIFDTLAKEREKGTLVETAFISRTNEPLVHAALKLLGFGIPFAIVGKDVSGDLIKHITKLVNSERMNDQTPIGRFKDALINHEEKENNKNSKYSTKKEYLASLKDTTLALTSSVDQFLGVDPNAANKKTLGEFKKWLQMKLGNNSFDFDQSDEDASDADLKAYREKLEREKPVVLTTSHKSKGLEFQRVFILRHDQFPHPRARHPDELGQEANTKYVSYTRAIHQLHLPVLEGQPGYNRSQKYGM